ncbi:MAG: FAD-dependent oxidoreductase [Oceanipulchritudo sp.]
MKTESASTALRSLKTENLSTDLVVVGGGVAGTCASIAAAREGLKVVLVQDRPVLGGNGSSEVRLWWLGATCHGLTNNRWAREPGIVNELMLDNLYHNPDGNPVLVDLVLLDKVKQEPNITLLLNTAVNACEKSGPDTIKSVTAFNPQNSTRYTIEAPLFCDASGDGILGFMAGAAFRMGAEKPEEFDEPLAPGEDFGELLGDSIYFYTKDAGHPVAFEAPSFAGRIQKDDIRMLRYFNLQQQGCQLWWIESGGRSDTVHEAEKIKWDLWAMVYGIWDYIKNSGDFPDSENLTLEWVGSIPGKRESRRFEGDYMLTQSDVVHAKPQPDAIGLGGWAIDLHPADGSFSKHPPAIQYLTRRIYPIPYRCLYSRNIRNLFLGGRTHSASHVAFGSTRVMATLGQLGEVIGRAASLCHKQGEQPAKLNTEGLQRLLQREGFHLPGIQLPDRDDLSGTASVTASSTWQPSSLPGGETWLPIKKATAQMLPLKGGKVPRVTLELKADEATTLKIEWRRPSLEGSHTPDLCLASTEIELPEGESIQEIALSAKLPSAGYAFLILCENPSVSVRLSDQQGTGILRLNHHGTQGPGDSHGDYLPANEVGCESFELWFREKRPKFRKNLAFQLDSPLVDFSPENVLKGPLRPTTLPNAWVADPEDPEPTLTLTWDQPKKISQVKIFFDPDWDHPLETVILRHGFRVMPSLVQDFDLLNGDGAILAEVRDNHQAKVVIDLGSRSVPVNELRLRVQPKQNPFPAAVFGIQILAEN